MLYAAATGLWLGSAFLPVAAEGNGSALSAHRFADLLVSGALPESAPSWLGLAWYAIPICAALTLMLLGVGGAAGAWLRACVVSVATVASLAFGAVVSDLVVSRVGVGVWLAVVAAACALLACWHELSRLGGRD